VTVFVVAGMAGQTNAWCAHDQSGVPEMQLASWDVLGKLAEEGVAIGAHTRTHRNLTGLRGEELQEEIEAAAQTIAARIGHWPAAFAYPYGAYDEHAVSAAGRAHAMACTTELRVLNHVEDVMRLPRLDTYYFRASDSLESYGSARFRQYLTLRRAGRAVRAALVNAGVRA
jgi:peptidoglycan/xylan/chitin deacetylase (PgdA/CDA1 family)